MTNKYHCKIFFSLLILILGVFPFTTAHSQSAENTAVYVLDSKGSINGNSIFITGKVANLLPYKVSDLTVQAIFITNGDYQTQVTNIDVIDANSSASFLLSFQISPAPEKYVVEVVEYRIETNDVNRLIEYFWNSGEDNALRVSAAASLSTLPAASRDEVLLRFSTSPIEINETSATVDLIEDLLLLPYLETHPSYDVAESMITRVNLYRNPEFSTALENLKNIAGDGNTIIPKLDQAATKDLNLSQIIEIIDF